MEAASDPRRFAAARRGSITTIITAPKVAVDVDVRDDFAKQQMKGIKMKCENGTKIGLATITAVCGFGVMISKDFLLKVKSEITTDDRCKLLQAGNFYDNKYRYYLVVNGETINDLYNNEKRLQEFLDDWEHQLLITVDDWENKKRIHMITDVCFF